MKNSAIAVLWCAVLALMSTGAIANEMCAPPVNIPKPQIEKIDKKENASLDYYVLAISWSPQHCNTVNKSGFDYEFQCKQNHFQFVVHGLWGENAQSSGSDGHPRHCGQSLVSDETVRKTLCTVPGVRLIQGEWQKHGTCTPMDEAAYFAKTRELWAALKKPDLLGMLGAGDRISAGEIIQAFVEENKEAGLTAESVVVRVAKKNRLKEVFICYGLDGQFTPCRTGGTPAGQQITVTKRW